MKNIYTKLCLSAIGCLMMASCDFLDVVPQGTATVDDIYRTQYQAEGMVLSCYANIPNYFHPQQFPDFTGGNEIITSKGGTTRWFHFRSLVYGEESPTTTYYSLWSNTAKSYPQGAVKKAVWESIRNCYNVLNNLDRVSDITPENLSWWKGEALFLIGYYHQIMLEYYGPIVIIDKEIPMESSPAEMMTSRSPYDTCVDFIANKYSEAARLLPGVWDSSKRNRATSSAALAFKARLLLYAASPLVNGNSEFYSDFKNPDGTFLINQTYDREKWKRAMDAAKEAIDLCEENGYKLYGNSTNDLEQGKKNYHEAFVGDGISGSGFNWNEVLFGFAEQGTISYCIKNMAPRVEFTSYSTKGFRGSLFPTWDCVSRYYTKNGLPWADDPETKKLDPYSIAPGDSTVRFHRNRDPRFYASIGFDRGNYDVQGKTIVLKCRRTASRNGLKHSLTLEQRKQIMAEAAEQRYAEFLGGETKYTGGTVHQLTEKSSPIEREFYEFYRTQRGEFTPDGATPMTTTHPTLSSNVKFMNFYPFEDIETISPRPMLFITGENAHSREFSEDAYRLAAEPKELYIVPGAGHVDLYDRVSLIPFNKLESFFKEYLKK